MTDNPLLIKCPKCGSTRDKLISSKWVEEEKSEVSQHKCKNCGEVYAWKIECLGEDDEEFDPEYPPPFLLDGIPAM